MATKNGKMCFIDNLIINKCKDSTSPTKGVFPTKCKHMIYTLIFTNMPFHTLIDNCDNI